MAREDNLVDSLVPKLGGNIVAQGKREWGKSPAFTQVLLSRWPRIPSHAPPPATECQAAREWHANAPEAGITLLGAGGFVHPLLLHALPADGVGKPERGAIKSHAADWEVRATFGYVSYLCEDILLINQCCWLIANYSLCIGGCRAVCFGLGSPFWNPVSLTEVLHGWPNIYQKWHPVATFSKLVPDVHLVEISVFFLCCSAILCFGKENENFYFWHSRSRFKCVFLHINRVWQLWFGKWKMSRVVFSKEGLLKTQCPSCARYQGRLCTQHKRNLGAVSSCPASGVCCLGCGCIQLCCLHPLFSINQGRRSEFKTQSWLRIFCKERRSCQKCSSLSSNKSQALPPLVVWGMFCYFTSLNQGLPLRRWEEWPVLGKRCIFMFKMVYHDGANASWTPHSCPAVSCCMCEPNWYTRALTFACMRLGYCFSMKFASQKQCLRMSLYR